MKRYIKKHIPPSYKGEGCPYSILNCTAYYHTGLAPIHQVLMVGSRAKILAS